MPLYISMDIFAVPDGTNTALLTRIITEAELAEKVYQTSSLATVDKAHEGDREEAVALTVVAAVGEVQVVPKGFVVMAIAPEHSSLAGAWAIAAKQKKALANNDKVSCKSFFIFPGFNF